MPLKYIKFCLPHLNLLTKIILVIGILLMAAVGAFAFRMQQGPMDLAFAKARIEAALSDPAKGFKVEINKVGLAWPEITDAILLDLTGVKIIQQDITGLSVNHVALGLSGIHLLQGKILPSLIVIDGPTFQLVQQDGSFNFFWQDRDQKNQAVKQDLNSRHTLRAKAVEFLEQITDPENQTVDALSALKRFEIKRAVIVDEKNRQDSGYLALADLSLHKHNLGLQGDMRIDLPGEEGNAASFKSEILYRREQKDLTLTADIKDINPARFAAFFPDYPLLKEQNLLLGGSVKAAFNQNLKLDVATLNLKIPEGQLSFPEAYEAPISLQNVELDAMLNREDNKLDVTRFDAIVGGIALQAKTTAIIKKGEYHAPIEVKIPELLLEHIAPIFPKSHLDSSAGEWLTKKLSDGRFSDVVLTTNFDVIRDPETGKRDAKMSNTKLAFKADGVTVKYSDTLMPVTEVVGVGNYENDILTIAGKSGKVGDISGKNVKLKITDLSIEGGGLADINLDASGPLVTALKYVSDEPISVGDKLGFDIKNVKGHVNFNLQLNFPTVKGLPKEKVQVKLKGKVNDILLPGVVRGLPLTGGPYDLGFNDGAITLKGNGQLAGRPIKLDWTQYLDSEGREFESKIIAQITADENLRKTFGIGLEEYISGPLPVDVTYLDKGIKATVDVKGDLASATLHIEPFDYRKEPNVQGNLSLKAYMKGEALEEVDQLALNTKGFSLAGGRIIFRKLKDGTTDISRGSIPQATLGKTKAKVDFEITPQDVLKIIAKGSIVDLSPFINTDKKAKGWHDPKKESEQPRIISVVADKMITQGGEFIRQSKLYLESNHQGDITRIEMDAKVGDGDMYLRFKPETGTGKRTFHLESSDAGYTLKAFGLYDKARGGKLVIYGQPQQGDAKGDLYGTAKMENFRVKSAPALAKLLSAMSLNGAQDLLKNDGLAFAKLESDFEWRFRESGNLLVVKDGRTSGSSLGLTFEGVVNQGTNETDISGTVIPLSGVNKALGDIPLIGPLLTGGDALIAATYTMKGPSNDPNVSVNPLSVLAPGFLRKILFEGSVEQKVKKAE